MYFLFDLLSLFMDMWEVFIGQIASELLLLIEQCSLHS